MGFGLLVDVVKSSVPRHRVSNGSFGWRRDARDSGHPKEQM